MSPTFEEVRLSLPHIELAAHLFGPEDGLPVIALHGWLDNANSFARLAPRLKGLRIIALDMAGHGHSGHRPNGAGYALWDYAHDVLQVAEQLGWKRFGLLGHSMGAIVSLAAAILVTQLAPAATPATFVGVVILAGLAGMAAGAVNGFCVTVLRLQPIVTTYAPVSSSAGWR